MDKHECVCCICGKIWQTKELKFMDFCGTCIKSMLESFEAQMTKFMNRPRLKA